MVAENVDADNGLPKSRHIGLDHIIVYVLLVAKRFQTLSRQGGRQVELLGS